MAAHDIEAMSLFLLEIVGWGLTHREEGAKAGSADTGYIVHRLI